MSYYFNWKDWVQTRSLAENLPEVWKALRDQIRAQNGLEPEEVNAKEKCAVCGDQLLASQSLFYYDANGAEFAYVHHDCEEGFDVIMACSDREWWCVPDGWAGEVANIEKVMKSS